QEIRRVGEHHEQRQRRGGQQPREPAPPEARIPGPPVALDGAQQDIARNGQVVSEVTQYGWTSVGVVELDVTGDMHTVEIHVDDVYGTVAGMAAHVTVDGGTCGDLLTGRDPFEYATIVNVNGIYVGMDGVAALAPHSYHNPPGSLGTAGAEYVWWDADATVLGSADFSVDLDVP
ncbi:MAG: hypothetical protein KC468_24525, partial [Myxococcales bacterium]|nr:hypothetical protein [Myxococcales bacterium]